MAMWNVHAKNAILLAVVQQKQHVCTYVLYMCIRYIWHAVLFECVRTVRTQITWKASTAMHVMQLRQTDSLHNVCRQTDLGTAVYGCEYSVYSEVHERKLLSAGICERGSRHGDGQKQLWAELGTCTQARVWKMLHCLLAYIHQKQKPWERNN